MRLLMTMLLALVLCSWVRADERISEPCLELKARLDTFLNRHNPFRADAPKAGFKTIETELGAPSRLEPEENGSLAVYVLDGCIGKVHIDQKGIVWTVQFNTVASIPAGGMRDLEQLESIEKKISELKEQLQSLEELKEAFTKQHLTSNGMVPSTSYITKPSEPSGVPEAADALYLSDRFEEAIPAYSQTILNEPANVKAHLRRAYCYQRLGRLQQAVEDYSDVIRLAPGERLAYENRAAAYLGLGQTDKALADYGKSKELSAGAGSLTSTDAGPEVNTTTSGKTTYVGPRGGIYHYSKSGKKVYEKRK